MVIIVKIIAPKLELGKQIQIVLGRADWLMAFFMLSHLYMYRTYSIESHLLGKNYHKDMCMSPRC